MSRVIALWPGRSGWFSTPLPIRKANMDGYIRAYRKACLIIANSLIVHTYVKIFAKLFLLLPEIDERVEAFSFFSGLSSFFLPVRQAVCMAGGGKAKADKKRSSQAERLRTFCRYSARRRQGWEGRKEKSWLGGGKKPTLFRSSSSSVFAHSLGRSVGRSFLRKKDGRKRTTRRKEGRKERKKPRGQIQRTTAHEWARSDQTRPGQLCAWAAGAMRMLFFSGKFIAAGTFDEGRRKKGMSFPRSH